MRIVSGISDTTSNKPTFSLQGFQKEKREKKTENLFEEIIVENFLSLGKETDI